MFRARYHFRLRSGVGWNDFLAIASKLNEMGKKKGHAELTPWTQVVGPFNEIVLEADYPDLATFERETNEMYADEEMVAAMRGWRDLVIEGSGHNELWTRADPVSG